MVSIDLLPSKKKIFLLVSRLSVVDNRHSTGTTYSTNTAMKVFASAIVASLLASTALGFAPVTPQASRASTTALASARQDEQHRKTVSSVLASAFVAVNVFATAMPALAVQQQDDFFAGSSQVIAGRSGGRSGGRASRGGNSRSYRSSAPSTTYKSYSSTTVIAPPRPAVVVAPTVGYGYSPYYSNPIGDLATGYAIGSIGGNIANSMRDSRQEREIEQSRYQLEQARMKEAELEGRLRALEAQQQAPVVQQQAPVVAP